jgi:hypothetical protein
MSTTPPSPTAQSEASWPDRRRPSARRQLPPGAWRPGGVERTRISARCREGRAPLGTPPVVCADPRAVPALSLDQIASELSHQPSGWLDHLTSRIHQAVQRSALAVRRASSSSAAWREPGPREYLLVRGCRAWPLVRQLASWSFLQGRRLSRGGRDWWGAAWRASRRVAAGAHVAGRAGPAGARAPQPLRPTRLPAGCRRDPPAKSSWLPTGSWSARCWS